MYTFLFLIHLTGSESFYQICGNTVLHISLEIGFLLGYIFIRIPLGHHILMVLDFKIQVKCK